ncbi:MAG: HIT domain-containing protein [Candidatus Babeliales bacterium]|nr:HIT domain-containing protein [Candidatus Babeliales bacterium]
MQDSCIFCKIINKTIPSSIIKENEDVIVIKDLYPKAPVHYLIIPKKHFSDIKDLEDSEINLAGKLLLMAKELSHDLSGSRAFRLVSNNGKESGQCVFHFHIHFLSGKQLLDF